MLGGAHAVMVSPTTRCPGEGAGTYGGFNTILGGMGYSNIPFGAQGPWGAGDFQPGRDLLWTQGF